MDKYEDELYRKVVDSVIRLGRAYATEHNRSYNIAFFAQMMWTIQPLIDAIEPVPEEVRLHAIAHDIPERYPLMNGPDVQKAGTLIEQMKKAIIRGDMREAKGCHIKMQALAASIGLPLPLIRAFHTPKAMQS